jgi:hypothetical protein
MFFSVLLCLTAKLCISLMDFGLTLNWNCVLVEIDWTRLRIELCEIIQTLLDPLVLSLEIKALCLMNLDVFIGLEILVFLLSDSMI